jgi:hypothetical protein
MKNIPPEKTVEGREQQLIALAVDLAEKQLQEGTASSQVISHYLKMSSTREKIELEALKQQNELTKAKTESIKSSKTMEELYMKALSAMATYRGNDEDEEL